MQEKKRKMMAKGNEKRLKKTRILPRRWSQLPLIDSKPSSLSPSLLALSTEGHSAFIIIILFTLVRNYIFNFLSINIWYFNCLISAKKYIKLI